MILPVINSSFGIKKHKYIQHSFPQINSGGYALHYTDTEDKFTPSANPLDLHYENTYKHIQDSLGIYSEKDIEKISKRIQHEFPDLSIEEILHNMSALSSYSSYSSMNNLAKKLYKNKISEIFDFSMLFAYKNKLLKEQNNNSFTPASVLKIPDDYTTRIVTQIPKNQGVPLGCILDYLTFFKYPMDYSAKKAALILDQNSIKLLKKLKHDSPETFKREFLNNTTLTPVYLDNFENSYNFLNQGKSFEQNTLELTRKYQTLKRLHPDFSQKKILDIIFNYKNLKDIQSLGFTPVRISISQAAFTDYSTIANNLNPVMPSKTEFTTMIKNIAGKTPELETGTTANLLLNYIDLNLNVYSPKSLSQKLQTLHKKITEEVKSKGRSEKNIYYTVLNPNKSFGLITYQYQKANNIPDDKIIYWKGDFCTPNTDLKLPNGSTIVILDDCFISGNSVMFEMFNYQEEANNLNRLKNNTNLLFASVLCTNTAKNRIKKNIEYAKRNNQDNVISVDTQNINWTDNLQSAYTSKFLKLIRKDSRVLATTAVVFPYMGSDTNAPGLRNLFSKFVPTENYLHSEVKEDNFFTD